MTTRLPNSEEMREMAEKREMTTGLGYTVEELNDSRPGAGSLYEAYEVAMYDARVALAAAHTASADATEENEVNAAELTEVAALWTRAAAMWGRAEELNDRQSDAAAEAEAERRGYR